MGLYVFDHFRPIVVPLNKRISFANAKMAKMVMHFLEYCFNKDFGSYTGFILFTIFFSNMIQEARVIITIWVPFIKSTLRVFHHFGYSSAKSVLLLQGFGVSYVNYTQWATLDIVFSLCYIY